MPFSRHFLTLTELTLTELTLTELTLTELTVTELTVTELTVNHLVTGKMEACYVQHGSFTKRCTLLQHF
jgi:hypothetical protein